jgi:hypothetical protein
MRDPRLAGNGLTTLVGLLTSALPRRDEVETLVERVNMAPDKVITRRRVDHQWQEAILGADERGKLDELLTAVQDELKEYPAPLAEFVAWLASARRRQKPADAVSEIARLRTEIRALPDPREGAILVQSLRSALLDVQEGFEDSAGRALLLAVDDRSASVARDQVLGAGRDALAAADTLFTGIQLADQLLKRRRPSDPANLAFRGEHDITRVLIDDRDDVAERALALLDILRSHAPAVFATSS